MSMKNKYKKQMHKYTNTTEQNNDASEQKSSKKKKKYTRENHIYDYPKILGFSLPPRANK